MSERGCAIPAWGLAGRGSGPPQSRDGTAGGPMTLDADLGAQRASAQRKLLYPWLETGECRPVVSRNGNVKRLQATPVSEQQPNATGSSAGENIGLGLQANRFSPPVLCPPSRPAPTSPRLLR